MHDGVAAAVAVGEIDVVVVDVPNVVTADMRPGGT